MRLLPLNMKANFLGERLLLTIWVGSLWAIGYIAVPMAFATLGDTTLAGNYAGKLFSVVNMLGLACGSVLLITMLINLGKQVIKSWRFWVVILMLMLILTFSFYLQPEIAKIKQLAMQGNDELLQRFAFLHEATRNIYMIISLLGLSLVVTTESKNG